MNQSLSPLIMTFYSFIFVKTLILESFSILMIMDFGDNMMLIRKKKGLSQAALGKLIGTSGDVVGRYERGDINPSIEVVSKIADALEVSVDFLIGKTDMQLDKDAIERLVSISKLPHDSKEYVLGLIDMALRDFKARMAYSK
jgi:transcriptional regulator with XRE-family HTH domain